MAEDSSVDVEAEPPIRLTELLKRLNGDLPTGETAITSTRQLKEFISEWSSVGMDWNVRERVLHTLAACKTLRRIYTFDLRDLSANNWETFLTPLRRSVGLEEVLFGYPEDHQECDATKLSLLGRLWADVLKTVESVAEIRFEYELSRKFVTELVVGLNDSTLPSLTRFSVDGTRVDSATAFHIASIVRHSPQLSTLELGDICTLSEDAVDAWTQALMGPESLELVTILNVCGIGGALAEGFSASCRKNVLKCLDLSVTTFPDLQKSEYVLPLLVKANIAELIVGTNITSCLSLDAWREVGAALQRVKALRRLEIHVLHGIAKHGLDGIRNLWELSGLSPLITLVLEILPTPDRDSSAAHWLTKIVKLTISTEIIFYFSNRDAVGRSLVEHEEVLSLFKRPDCPVKALTFIDLRAVSLGCLFESLKKNTSITELKFKQCWQLSDDDFKKLMDLLQVNFALEDIDLDSTPWRDDGKAALVKEALERNLKQASYFSVMRKAEFEFVGRKVGRIFLCGSLFAGKTRVENKWKLLQDGEHGRTKGIEVDWLEWENGKKFSIWDLGGQHIFRALQELLFPKISKVCAFIFVYSPFRRTGKIRDPRVDPVADFEEDLKQWLRFIISNTQVTGSILLPRVFLTITHKDHIQDAKYNFSLVLDDYIKVVERLRSRFEGVVDLYRSPNDIHYINAKTRRM
ncbi:hypothetical protein R1sor_005423 [Riccia sorocarpa]|uniref:Uncharacterized protein n=1 Tax=Riccia sorocarpa TaxID=122646 RepID=A0ABD3HJR0_9MARC